MRISLPHRLKLTVATVAILVVATATSAAPAAASASPGTASGPVGSYIVMLKDTAAVAAALEKIQSILPAGTVTQTFDALGGFAAKLTPAQLEALQRSALVELVEPDSVMTTQETWGLDRIDQPNLPLDNSYTAPSSGWGVRAYIIDTGIQRTHPQFGTRVYSGYTAIKDGRGTEDCNGHGTHVAGTVGSSTYGVAKSVLLIAVRVLGCNGSGSNSGVIAGMDWVAKNAKRPAVANMSLGGVYSLSTNLAVKRLTEKGITLAVAAGNDDLSSCYFSPASASTALTVAASTRTDRRASFSNYGRCVDLFAPGQDIRSTWLRGGTNTISGTSMASPHVAGVAALVLQANPTASPSAVASIIKSDAARSKISGANGSANLLVQVP